MSRLPAILTIAAAIVAWAPAPAAAHKVIAAVYAGTTEIEGEVGFSNGDTAADALVEVFDGTGTKLGETRTDADGFFTFTPVGRVTHVFRADLGAGHVVEIHMDAAELPGAAAGAAPAAATAAATASGAAAGAPLGEEQRAAIAEAVRREIVPLRRELAAYKEKTDLQSVLGGLGYIAGLFGVGFYLAARRRLRSA